MDAHASHVFIETLAWTLIHFLWQGALVALVLWLVMSAMSSSSSRSRYMVRCGALVLMAFAPTLTFVWLWGDAPPVPTVIGAGGVALADVSGVLDDSVWSQPLTWVVAGWCLGAALCVLRFSGGLLQVVRLKRKTVGIDLAPRWQRSFDVLARDFGVRARARVVESAQVCVPAVIGCIRPIVLLPARIFSGLSDAQIEALIAHELAHVARHDYLVNIAQSIVESLLFYHPAVWWVSRGIRVEREYCCDDLAVAATQNGLAYAHALTALESWRGAQPQLGVSTLGGSLMSRIQRLVGLQPERPRRAIRPAHAIAGLFVAGTLSASALAFVSLPEPAVCDCKCACHKKAGKAKANTVFGVDATRSFGATDGQDLWEVIGSEGPGGRHEVLYFQGDGTEGDMAELHAKLKGLRINAPHAMHEGGRTQVIELHGESDGKAPMRWEVKRDGGDGESGEHHGMFVISGEEGEYAVDFRGHPGMTEFVLPEGAEGEHKMKWLFKGGDGEHSKGLPELREIHEAHGGHGGHGAQRQVLSKDFNEQIGKLVIDELEAHGEHDGARRQYWQVGDGGMVEIHEDFHAPHGGGEWKAFGAPHGEDVHVEVIGGEGDHAEQLRVHLNKVIELHGEEGAHSHEHAEKLHDLLLEVAPHLDGEHGKLELKTRIMYVDENGEVIEMDGDAGAHVIIDSGEGVPYLSSIPMIGTLFEDHEAHEGVHGEHGVVVGAPHGAFEGQTKNTFQWTTEAPVSSEGSIQVHGSRVIHSSGDHGRAVEFTAPSGQAELKHEYEMLKKRMAELKALMAEKDTLLKVKELKQKHHDK